MTLLEPTDDIRLNDGEALLGPVLQVLFHFLSTQPLKKKPAGITEVEERFAILIDESAAVGADGQFHPFHGLTGRTGFGFRSGILRWIGLSLSVKCRHPGHEKE